MSKPEWNAAEYEKFRPSYDPATFDRISAYHAPTPFGHALELGCGTGLASQSIAPLFDRLTAMDPSGDMLQAAKDSKKVKTKSGQEVDFRLGGAESLDFLPDNSVDLICAATAAHWFPASWWSGAKRVLVKNGTVALFTYGGYNVSTGDDADSAAVDEINKTAQYLLDDAAFGPREGNKVVTGLYDTLPVPENDGSWSAVERPKWTFVHKDRPMNCDQFWNLLLTASHLREYKEQHPDTFDKPGDPMEEARQAIHKSWPQNKTCYMAQPMVIVMLKKLA